MPANRSAGVALALRDGGHGGSIAHAWRAIPWHSRCSGHGLVDPAQPWLRADDEAVLRGRAAFETLRVYAGRPFRLAEHLERLTGSAEVC